MQTFAAPLFRFASALSMVAIAACGGGSTDATGASPSGATACVVEPTFASIQTHLLATSTCAVSGCHATPGQGALSFDGSADDVYRALVNAPSSGSLLARVEPGAPEASLLYLKLADAVPPSGARMPEGAPPLPACAIDAVKSWIAAGAPPR